MGEVADGEMSSHTQCDKALSTHTLSHCARVEVSGGRDARSEGDRNPESDIERASHTSTRHSARVCTPKMIEVRSVSS